MQPSGYLNVKSSSVKKALILLPLLLSACVSQTERADDFRVPQVVEFQGNRFEQANHSHIDDMQQLLYLPQQSEKNPNNWQQGILIFLDKNHQGQTLSERAELRRQRFTEQPQTYAQVSVANGELESRVIYPPSVRFPDVMLEVSRGRNLTCGFGQIQFADKRSVSGKNVQNLSLYRTTLAELAGRFAQLPWLIGCK